jgi:hypothetical protein
MRGISETRTSFLVTLGLAAVLAAAMAAPTAAATADKLVWCVVTGTGQFIYVNLPADPSLQLVQDGTAPFGRCGPP